MKYQTPPTAQLQCMMSKGYKDPYESSIRASKYIGMSIEHLSSLEECNANDILLDKIKMTKLLADSKATPVFIQKVMETALQRWSFGLAQQEELYECPEVTLPKQLLRAFDQFGSRQHKEILYRTLISSYVLNQMDQDNWKAAVPLLNKRQFSKRFRDRALTGISRLHLPRPYPPLQL